MNLLVRLTQRGAVALTEITQFALYWLGGGNGDPDRLRAADARRARARNAPAHPARSAAGRGARKR
ncbi:hypothetical protein K2F54_03875 [Cryobacterium sp. 1639]|uniref:hypothetical protein n=1 Tax=Cryobacterium inferilacus TaxID=2866629 RepID=UPI001C7368D5|nr:hypothetical protein [Cryobacterium sp. 1639]MBX0299110.1 hypothetical protein [Cryobacterium sp. 1639]